jgi:hypothetical protein
LLLEVDGDGQDKESMKVIKIKDGTEWNRTEQNGTEQNRTEQNRTEQNGTEGCHVGFLERYIIKGARK